MTEKYRVELEVDCNGVETAGVIIEIAGERKRQQEFYHFGSDLDDTREGGELALAAMCYQSTAVHNMTRYDGLWPFDLTWWKPKDVRRNLIKAAALIVAEIERLDRLDELVGSDDGEIVNEKIEPTLPIPHRSR